MCQFFNFSKVSPVLFHYYKNLHMCNKNLKLLCSIPPLSFVIELRSNRPPLCCWNVLLIISAHLISINPFLDQSCLQPSSAWSWNTGTSLSSLPWTWFSCFGQPGQRNAGTYRWSTSCAAWHQITVYHSVAQINSTHVFIVLSHSSVSGYSNVPYCPATSSQLPFPVPRRPSAFKLCSTLTDMKYLSENRCVPLRRHCAIRMTAFPPIPSCWSVNILRSM